MILKGQKNFRGGLMDSESIGESIAVIDGRGGYREGAGAKPDWFKARCRELACSRAFFKFANRVFEGDPIEPRLTKTGVIFTEASTHDKVYLWEKLAGYGFGKPISVEPMSVEKSVENATAALAILKLMQEAQNGNNIGVSASGNTASLDERRSTSQASSTTA